MPSSSLQLGQADEEMLAGGSGPAVACAMRMITKVAQMLGATELVSVSSAHIDGCLYHGDSGVLFAEKLAQTGVRVCVPTTLNVGALDLLHEGVTRLDASATAMATRMANAYVAMGCRQTWTCAPYQAGHRPKAGEDVAWGESNAVAFCNSVLGARTNRYGDFLDICAALTGRVPRTGLHIPANRLATVLVDATKLPRDFLRSDVAYPIIGSWLGRTIGTRIAALEGLEDPTEDRLKALGAAAASSGSVGLFHVVGTTPEAKDRDRAFGGRAPEEVIILEMSVLDDVRARLSTVTLQNGAPLDAVAIGSPHLSAEELRQLAALLGTSQCRVPLYACTSRRSLESVRDQGIEARLRDRGVTLVTDTCIVVTPILVPKNGVLLTNSAKFAHYTPANTGYEVVFGSLDSCVASAISGRLTLGT
ncbi:MAG: aconitase X catalytic domain-containing protein [Proteobacteria bacterium]|nr:aconitase X catalytic domain-containing protein [Pseudomonadota bacterium]